MEFPQLGNGLPHPQVRPIPISSVPKTTLSFRTINTQTDLNNSVDDEDIAEQQCAKQPAPLPCPRSGPFVPHLMGRTLHSRGYRRRSFELASCSVGCLTRLERQHQARHHLSIQPFQDARDQFHKQRHVTRSVADR